MALPIIHNWQSYFTNPHEGLGSSYERIILNRLLLDLKNKYDIKSLLEVPIFGFTGITGINSVDLYLSGCDVTLVDHDKERIVCVDQILKDLDVEIKVEKVESYNTLPFHDKSFDMTWNFSALWFVEDLNIFLSELSRITKKVILLCVPNQSGMGYRWQKAHSDIPSDIVFNENNINPSLIKTHMRKLDWHFVSEAYIDCPLWPDIGMSKEKFLAQIIPAYSPTQHKEVPEKQINILDYYKGLDPGFADRMLKFSFLENHAPKVFKKYWSHHRWLLFIPK